MNRGESSQREIFEKSNQESSQSTTCSREDFLARVSALLGSGEDLTIQEELYSLKSHDWLKNDSLSIFCLKTSGDYFRTMEEKLLEQSSTPFQTWGTVSNGRCLTAKTSESHRTENECSLSDILENSVDDKYFLSKKAKKFLKRREVENQKAGRGFGAVYHLPSIRESGVLEMLENLT